MVRMKRVKVAGKSTAHLRPWSRHEELALVRAWTNVVRRPSAARAADMDADDELLVEFQQALVQCDTSNNSTTEDAPAVPRTKGAVRAKMNRLVSSFKCIQEHLRQHQQVCGDRRAADRTGEDWFALSTKQQLGILARGRPENSKSSFCTIEKDVFELLERVLQDEKPPVRATEKREHFKWSDIETRHLVQSWREELESNPTARPNATSMFERFSELSSGNTRRKSITFIRKLKLILKTYTAFLDFEQSATMDETHSHASDLPERFRKFNERQGRMCQPLDMDDDTIHALGEIKRMLDCVSSPGQELHRVFRDGDSSSDDDSGVQRYKIKRGAHDQIDLVERESCSSESEDDTRCWKRPRASQVSSPQGDMEFVHGAAATSQESVAATVSIDSDGEGSARFGIADKEVETMSFVGCRECGCSTRFASVTSKLNQISAIVSSCDEGTHGQKLTPVRADRSGSRYSNLLETPDKYHHQTQYPRFLFEEAALQTSNGHDECVVMLRHLHEESRRDRDEMIRAIYRVQLEQQRTQAIILRALESLGKELRNQQR